MANPRKPAARHQSSPQPAPDADAPITRVDFSEVRTGEDTRQRGWFWHWNELHTEYEPLLKHSGIGLITSYIVWTDRREHSPYRGYAFPSLQSQAAFSGSDRAELMTINRILVALDLIEIRKEMVLRVDAQGHKWRVPHNLYRVKDRSGDPHLTAEDVLHVLRLAEQRTDVYRHVRHVLTSSFVPISHNNIWHELLAELRPTPLWERLAARASIEEARFSARSKAGHASRKSKGPDVENPDDLAAKRGSRSVHNEASDPDFFIPGADARVSTGTVVTNQLPGSDAETIAAPSTDGFQTLVADTNHGLDENRQSSDARSNQARATSVAPTNPMYDQSIQTTRTSTGARIERNDGPVTAQPDPVTPPVTRSGVELSQASAGPGTETAPSNGPARAAARVAFAEANGREASAAEERLLGRIADEGGVERGWQTVTAAIYEAVDSGSAFVAPKRVREIVRRWQRDGLPAELALEADVDDEQQHERGTNAARSLSASSEPAGPFWIAEAGIGSVQLWSAVVEIIARDGAVRPAEIHDYLKPAVLLERSGESTLRLGVAHELARQRIEHRWRANLEEALARLIGAGWVLDIQVMGGAGRKSA